MIVLDHVVAKFLLGEPDDFLAEVLLLVTPCEVQVGSLFPSECFWGELLFRGAFPGNRFSGTAFPGIALKGRGFQPRRTRDREIWALAPQVIAFSSVSNLSSARPTAAYRPWPQRGTTYRASCFPRREATHAAR